MHRLTGFIAVLLITLSGCNDKEDEMTIPPELKVAYDNLAFTCVHESVYFPPFNEEVDSIYRYALFLQNKDGPKDFDEAARYYRIAAAHENHKAAANLQMLISQGLARSPDAWKETIDVVQSMLAIGIPGAYYDMGHYLEVGYGVKQDSDKARIYFRIAADRGNPDAQFYVAQLLGRIKGTAKTMLQMERCAMEQGHQKAARSLAGYSAEVKRYSVAIEAYHQGAKNGHPTSAGMLEEGFKGPPIANELYYLGLPNDPERSRRYALMFKFLNRYESLGAKVPDIDQIVPLPPTKLPEWDGTFQWQKDRDAAVPPQKPSDELIERLCKEKGLDPKTGLAIVKDA